jgi:hypothetical protein
MVCKVAHNQYIDESGECEDTENTFVLIEWILM